MFFPATHASDISSDTFASPKCQILLHVLCTAFISLMKHDMCQGVSQNGRSVSDVVNKAFTTTDIDIEASFMLVAGSQKVKN